MTDRLVNIREMSPRSPEQFAQIRKERREQILQAALEVFAEDSYHGASMASVAKKAKVSKGLIYNYFKSKEELLKTLIVDIFDEVMELMDVDPDVPLNSDGFVKFVELSIDEVIRNPKRWKLYMSLSFQPDVTPIMMTEMMPKIQPFMVLLNNYFAEKGHEDPIATMRYWSAIMDGVQMHYLLDPDNFPIEKVKKMMIDQFA